MCYTDYFDYGYYPDYNTSSYDYDFTGSIYDYPSSYDYDFTGSIYDPLTYPSSYDYDFTGSIYDPLTYPSSYDYDFTGSIYDDPYYVPPSTPTPTTTTDTSTLDSILKTLGSIFTSKGVLAALGLGTAAAGAAAGGSGGGTPNNVGRTQQKLGPLGQQGMEDTYALAQLLYPQAFSPLNDYEQSFYNYIMGNAGEYMNVFPKETWQRAEDYLAKTDEETSLALEKELEDKYGMKMEGRGNVNEQIMAEVLAREAAWDVAMSNLLAKEAAAQQQAYILQPAQFAAMLGLANYPEQQQADIIKTIVTILNNMAITEKGGQPTMTYNAYDQPDTNILGSILPAISAALLTLAGTTKS